MRFGRKQSRLMSRLVTSCVLGSLVTGCTIVGPPAVYSGRLAYNEAIIETDNQQMLLAVVRNRYGERSNLLAVSSVTANVRIAASAAIELGVGDNDDYAGNLVPFSAGFIYEENPTISYIPVGGEKYAREFLSPISITSLAQLTANLVDPGPVYYTLVSSLNGIYNPNFQPPSGDTDPRFVRLVSILTELAQDHRLHWIQDPKFDHRMSIVIDHYWPRYESAVDELLTLLGLPMQDTHPTRIELPVSLALDEQDEFGIQITTRSVFDLVEIMSGAVEVPDEDRTDGVALSYPPPGLVGKQIRVHYTDRKPERASVSVRYRDGWFHIDERDQPTKQFFRLMTTLMSIHIAESGVGGKAPVLTVPVSR